MAGIEVVLARAGRIGVVDVFPPYVVGLFSLRPKVQGPQDPAPVIMFTCRSGKHAKSQ